MAEPQARLQLRMPLSVLARVDRLVAVLREDPALSLTGRVSRSVVLRLALSRGLISLEAEYLQERR